MEGVQFLGWTNYNVKFCTSKCKVTKYFNLYNKSEKISTTDQHYITQLFRLNHKKKHSYNEIRHQSHNVSTTTKAHTFCKHITYLIHQIAITRHLSLTSMYLLCNSKCLEWHFPKPDMPTFTKELLQHYQSDKHLKGSFLNLFLFKKSCFTSVNDSTSFHRYHRISTHSHNLLQGKIIITGTIVFSILFT